MMEKLWQVIRAESSSDEPDVLARLSKAFSDENLYGERTGAKIVSKLTMFTMAVDKGAPVDLDEKQWERFVSGVSKDKELLNSLFVGFKIKEHKDFLGLTSYINLFTEVASYENDYYEKIGLKEISSKTSYSYLDFLRGVSALVREIVYEEFSPSVPKLYYSVPENRKIGWFVPSASLLRDLGIDIDEEKDNFPRAEGCC